MNVRPHHALCAQFFEGKGYSPAFVEHMTQTLEALDREGTLVALTEGTDEICAGCPNNRNGICETEEKVRGIDRRALRAMGLAPGDVLPWETLCQCARDHIIAPGRLREICVDCQWIHVCGKSTENRSREDCKTHVPVVQS